MTRISNLLFNKRLLLALRLAMGSIFISAGLSKLIHPGEFVSLVVNYHVLPVSIAQVYGFMLPWVELVIGALLLSGLFKRVVASISLAILGSFFIANLSVLISSSGINSCGCFGSIMPLSHTGSLTLGLFMILVSIMLLWGRRTTFIPRQSTHQLRSVRLAVNVFLTFVILISSLPGQAVLASNMGKTIFPFVPDYTPSVQTPIGIFLR